MEMATWRLKAVRNAEVEGELPQEALRRLVGEVAAAYGVGEEQVRSTAAFRSFRGGDSLDMVQLVVAMDDELRGPQPPARSGSL
jgi:hypothetical protein